MRRSCLHEAERVDDAEGDCGPGLGSSCEKEHLRCVMTEKTLMRRVHSVPFLSFFLSKSKSCSTSL